MPMYQVGYECPIAQGFYIYEVYREGSLAGPALKRAMERYKYLEGYKWRIRKLRDDGLPEDWREREKMRFENGTYKPVPWSDEEWYQPVANEHFCYLSLKEPGKIAYTENAQKGEADRQTIIGAGRYLTRYFKDQLDASEIERLACLVSVEADACGLKVTQDADEIEEVYENGPRSCMAGSADDFSGPCHPARVYAGPDLGLAYTGAREKASGRAVVWPEKKRYGRIYGDETRMRMLLEEAGYSKGSFYGARIRRIDAGDNEFVMPYIDGFSTVDDDGTYIVLRDGEICCENTSGLGEINNRQYCPSCGDMEDRDDFTYIEDVGESWCGYCTREHATYCELSDEYLSDRRNTFVEVNVVSQRWDTIQQRYVPYLSTATAWQDHDDVIYVEDSDEYWTQEALDFQAKQLRSERAKRGWETRRANQQQPQLALAA